MSMHQPGPCLVLPKDYVEIPKGCMASGPDNAKLHELQQKTGCGIKLVQERCRSLVEISHADQATRIIARKMLDELVSRMPHAAPALQPTLQSAKLARQANRMPVDYQACGGPHKPVLAGWDAPVRCEKKLTPSAPLPPVVRNFYREHPEVTAMTKAQVDQFRKENMDICVKAAIASQMVKPVPRFEHAFADYPEILNQLTTKFARPFPIQCQAWPILLQGHDLIGIAQTGTGKTLAFLLPAFIHVVGQTTPRPKRRGPSVLVLSPTRELAQQIHEEVSKYSYQNIRSACVYGGSDRSSQMNALRQCPEVVIATPGRLNELLDLGVVKTEHITYLVLDEADRMLDMGFEPQIRRIIDQVRTNRQTVMTSATWPSGVRRLADRYLQQPVHVTVGSPDLTSAKSVIQRVRMVREHEKMAITIQLLRSLQPDDKCIVFCGRKMTTERVADRLRESGVPAETIHGDRTQKERESALWRLKSGHARVLVATDVASRGLDVPDITVVLNYDFPTSIEEYVHRVGRTGRAGRTGSAYTMMTLENTGRAKELVQILRKAGQEVPKWLLSYA